MASHCDHSHGHKLQAGLGNEHVFEGSHGDLKLCCPCWKAGHRVRTLPCFPLDPCLEQGWGWRLLRRGLLSGHPTFPKRPCSKQPHLSLMVPDRYATFLDTLCDSVAQAQSPPSGLYLKSMALFSVFFQCTGWYLESVTDTSDFLTLPYDAVIYKLQNVSHKASSKF